MPRISKEREAAVRSRIFEAAISVFERRGFARASMSAIAEEAGLSSGAIYTYFGSKEELFLAAFGSLVEEQERALTDAIADSDDTSGAIGLAVDYMSQVAAGGGDFRGAGANFLLHAWATADENEALRAMLLRRREQASALARTVIDGAISRGELSGEVDAAGPCPRHHLAARRVVPPARRAGRCLLGRRRSPPGPRRSSTPSSARHLGTRGRSGADTKGPDDVPDS